MELAAPRVAPRELRPPLFSDGWIVGITLALVGISLVMIYSTTGVSSQEKLGDSLFYLKRQAAGVLAGLAFMAACSRVKVDSLRRVSPFLFFVCAALLALTLIPGLGDSAGGARRWIQLGPVRFQPGEFVKLAFVVYMAGYLARHENKLATFGQGVLKPLLLVGVVCALFLGQPDFGSSVVIVMVSIAMAAVTGVRLRYIVLSGAFVAVCAALLVLISPYRMSRVMTFLSPMEDASGKGYQLVQSLIAVGTGHVHGVGLGASQQKLFFLPAAHTDFIFAVIAEELGFIGCATVIALFLLFFWRGLRVAGRLAEDAFSFSLAVGLTLLIVLPALLNIGVVTGLLPTKGMVLPLVGFGSSSLVSCLSAVGLLLALARAPSKR